MGEPMHQWNMLLSEIRIQTRNTLVSCNPVDSNRINPHDAGFGSVRINTTSRCRHHILSMEYLPNICDFFTLCPAVVGEESLLAALRNRETKQSGIRACWIGNAARSQIGRLKVLGSATVVHAPCNFGGSASNTSTTFALKCLQMRPCRAVFDEHLHT